MRHLATVTSAIAIAMLPIGCGSGGPTYPTARLAGAVTVAGQRLPPDAIGVILFMPSGSGQPASCPIADGRYDCASVPVGRVTAVIKITRPTGRMVVEQGAPESPPYPERENLVPEKSRAGIPLVVDADNPSADFEL